MHSGVDLDMNRMRRDVAVDDGGGEPVDAVGRGHRGDEVVGDEFGDDLRRLLAEHEDRSLDTGLAEDHAFRHQRDAESSRPGGQRGATHLDGPVPVTVSLDNRPHLGGRGSDAQLADVVGDRVEVDLRPRPPRVVFGDTHCVPPRRDLRAPRLAAPSLSFDRSPRIRSIANSSITRGRAAATSLAISPAAGCSEAAVPCSQAPAAAASNAGIPLASSAPIVPDSTSPVPAVARR